MSLPLDRQFPASTNVVVSALVRCVRFCDIIHHDDDECGGLRTPEKRKRDSKGRWDASFKRENELLSKSRLKIEESVTPKKTRSPSAPLRKPSIGSPKADVSPRNKGEGVACRWDSFNGQRGGRPELQRRWSWESKPHDMSDCSSFPPPTKRSIGFSKLKVSSPSVPQGQNSMDHRHLKSSSDHGPLSARKTSLDRRVQFEESADSMMPLPDSDSTLRYFLESDTSLATDHWSPFLDDSERSPPEIPQRYFSDEFSIESSIDEPDFAGELSTEESGKERFLRQFEKSVPPPPLSIRVASERPVSVQVHESKWHLCKSPEERKKSTTSTYTSR
jgi:hypothetical protein